MRVAFKSSANSFSQMIFHHELFWFSVMSRYLYDKHNVAFDGSHATSEIRHPGTDI